MPRPIKPRWRSSPIIAQRARQLRRVMTPTEKKLWLRLRDRQLAGLYIRRQHAIGQYIADFYCAHAKLIIEVDGDTHAEPNQQVHDAARTAWFVSQGYRVVRFTNQDVATRIEGVLEEILRVCRASRH